MNHLICLKERIEELSKFHQVEILKIFKSNKNITINENKNGIFINMTNISIPIITQLEEYLKYVNKQEKHLNEIEVQKDELTNTYFKDNKDNLSISLNAN
jgi:hypothetical protein